jgi:hypothetical protein
MTWSHHNIRLAVCAIVGVIAFTVGLSPVLAQETVEPTDAQQTLNDEGVRALIEGDYAGAVSLLERSIRLGEVNVTYLNLGRAYQKMERCEEAREALEAAKTSPAVADPPRDEVQEVADGYLAELAEQCSEAADATDATDTSDTSAQQVQAVDDGESDTEDEAVSALPADDSGGVDALAVGVTVSGAALIGGAVGLHFVAESERSEVTDAARDDAGNIDSLTQVEARRIEKRANTMDSVAMAMGVGGAVVTGVGVYLFLNESEGDPEGVSVRVGARDVGLVWMRRF